MTGKTIIYLPNWLGDMVMATPFLRALRDSLDDELWGVGKSTAMHLYNGLNLFNRFIPFDSKRVISFLDMISNLRSLRFERGILLPHSFRSALLFVLSSVHHRVGYRRDTRGFMLSQSVKEPDQAPQSTVEHYLRMLDALGVARGSETPFLAVTEDEEHRFDAHFMDVGGEYVAFIVGASYGSSKRWPEEHFSQLADMITDAFPVQVYLLPGKGEEAIAARVHDGARNKDRTHIKMMDVRDLKVCLARSSMVVSNDTGPRHISVALSVPTVAILGPMDDRYTQYRNNCTYPVTRDVACRPCNRKKCDREHECLKGISAVEVFRPVREVLSDRLSRAD